MRKAPLFAFIYIITLLLISIVCSDTKAQTSDEPRLAIETPRPGQAVQGLVQIEGVIRIDGFQSYSLAFSFSGQESWFPIISNGTELAQRRLGEWDTSAITDGNYDLLLSVVSADGELVEVKTEGIRVRNYSNIETDTHQPTEEQAINVFVESTATLITTATPRTDNSPTPYPQNQASFSNLNIYESLIKGGILGIILFGLLALIFLRKKHN